MKNKYIGIFFLLLLVLSSCKTEYEKIRTGGDPQKMYTKAMAYYESGDYLKAQGLIETALPFYRGKAEAEELYFKMAYTYYYLQDYLLAASYFQNFGRTFLNSKYREEADFMSADSYYQSSPSFMLDQAYTHKAIEAFQSFANRYPSSQRVGEVNKRIDELRGKLEQKAFYNAKLYYDMEDYQAANRALEDILVSFPDINRGEEIRFLIVKSHYNLAVNSVLGKQKERLSEASLKAKAFIKRYPKSKYKRDVKTILKTIKAQLKSNKYE